MEINKQYFSEEQVKSGYLTKFITLLMDECGHIYVWSTSNVVHPNMTIKATVKGHNVYRGVNQTVITRGSIL